MVSGVSEDASHILVSPTYAALIMGDVCMRAVTESILTAKKVSVLSCVFCK